MIGRLFCLCAVALLLAPAAARAERVVYAIHIGHNGAPAGESRPALQYADDDAIRMHDLFKRVARTALLLTVADQDTQTRFPAAPATALRPTLDNLRRVLARLDSELARDLARGDRPVLILTFSGHGSTTAAGELALTLEDGGLTRSILYEELLAPRPNVEVHLIVDACRAGGVVGVRGPFDRELEGEVVSGAQAASAQAFARGPLSRFPHVGALVAASSAQETHEWSRIRSGVFTHEVLSALAGAADVNGDFRVEYSEVEAFVAAANRTLPDPDAAPHIIAHPPAADARATLMATDQLRDTFFLRGEPGSLGRFDIVLENGVHWLSAHAEAHGTLALAVPQGVAKYLRTERSEGVLPLRSAEPVLLSSVQLASKALTARGRLDDSYRRELFRSAYGPSYYRGYVDKAGLPSVSFADVRSREGKDRPSLGRRGRAAVALWSSAAAFTLGAGASGFLALQAKRDFEQTELMARSIALRDDYRRYGLIAGSTGALALSAWVVGTWLWVGREPSAPLRAFAPGGVRW